MVVEEAITAANLREHRRAARMTQVEVAYLLGLDKTAISCIENGGRQLAHAEKLVLEYFLLGRVPRAESLETNH